MVCEGLPLTFIESPRVRAILRPEIGALSATTLKSMIMDRYREKDKRIAERLRKMGSKVSVALDCWTSHDNKAFMGITGHYVDDNWTSRSLVLACTPLAGRHTGENLCPAFVAKCEQFGLLHKLLCVTTDNASNLTRFLAHFAGVCQSKGITFNEKKQHVRCLAHVINLAVQILLRKLGTGALDDDCSPDGDTVAQASDDDHSSDDNHSPDDDRSPGDDTVAQASDDACSSDGDTVAQASDDDHNRNGRIVARGPTFSCITKLRRLVVKVHSSPQRREAFRAECDWCHTGRKELIRDVRTRWNSTYAMIKRACELRDPLSRLAKSDSAFSAPSDEEWELLEVVAQVLRVFEEASQPLCAVNYPTLNKAVPTYNCLFDELRGFLGMRNDDDGGRANAAVIDRCSPANRDVLRSAIGAALAKLRFYYKKTRCSMYAIAVILDPRFKLDYFKERGWKPDKIRKAVDALRHAVEEYETAPSQPDRDDDEARLGLVDRNAFRGLKRRRIQGKSNVERYLGAPTVDCDEDILKWWSRHADIYPALARVARDYLAVPATSAPVERVFSGGAHLVTDRRGSLNEDTIEALVCLASWLS